MEPVLVLDCHDLATLKSELHAQLGQLFGGVVGRFLRTTIRADHLRIEAHVPAGEVAAFKSFLRRILRFNAQPRATRVPGAGLKVEPSESGLHVLAVYDLRADCETTGSTTMGSNASFLDRLATRIAGGAVNPQVGEAQIQRELFDTVDALCRGDQPPTGRLVVELWDAPEWAPIISRLLPRAASRAQERLRLTTGASTPVTAILATGTGTLPPDSWDRRLLARWLPPHATASSPAAAAPPAAQSSDEGTFPPADLQATLMPKGLRAEVTVRSATSPRTYRRVELALHQPISLDRMVFGQALLAVGADPRLLPRGNSPKAAVVRIDGTSLTVVQPGEANRYGIGDESAELLAGAVVPFPTDIVVSAGSESVPVRLHFEGQRQ